MASLFEKVLEAMKGHYGDQSASLPKFITSTKATARYPIFEDKPVKKIAALDLMASSMGGIPGDPIDPTGLVDPTSGGELPALGVPSSLAAPPLQPPPDSPLPGEEPTEEEGLY